MYTHVAYIGWLYFGLNTGHMDYRKRHYYNYEICGTKYLVELRVKIRRYEKTQAIHLWKVIIEIYVYRDMCVQTKVNRPKTALH